VLVVSEASLYDSTAESLEESESEDTEAHRASGGTVLQAQLVTNGIDKLTPHTFISTYCVPLKDIFYVLSQRWKSIQC
jgi:hypothetical protein